MFVQQINMKTLNDNKLLTIKFSIVELIAPN